jgi:Fe-S-cluster-containing dehydrogenase component
MVIDVTRCTGCHNCFIACKDEFDGNDYAPISAAQPKGGQDWIRVQEVEQGSDAKIKVDYIPILCQQCADAPCVGKGPEGAIYRRADGIVVIDPVKAQGHKELVNICPYRAIQWNAEAKLPQKCTFCAHMIDNGEKTTRCVESCPTSAMIFGDLDDPNSEISQYLAKNAAQAEAFKPEYGTKSSVKYIGLPKLFLVGEVLLADKTGECVKGAKITLTAVDDAKAVQTTETDFLGDFEFNDLDQNRAYTLKVEYAGYKATELSVRTNASRNVGVITLQK